MRSEPLESSNTMLHFNAKGFLIPNLNISSSLEELESEFVDNIDSERRRHLFTKYVEYSNLLKSKLTESSLLQWIDGSFISKKSDPADIDIVSFINYKELENNDKRLDMFKYPFSLANFELDAYIVLVYPRDHKNYPLYVGDRLYWMDLFDKARRNRSGVKSPKGFLELQF